MVTGGETLGARVRALRVQRGLSQAQLAYPTLSDSYISLIESDKRSPAEDVLAFLADRLECSVSYLISGVTEAETRRLADRLGVAREALESGRAAEAAEAYASIGAERATAMLPGYADAALWGWARALEEAGDPARALDVLARYERRLDPQARPGHALELAAARCRCLRSLGETAAAVHEAEEAMHRPLPAGTVFAEGRLELGAALTLAHHTRGDLVRAAGLADEIVALADHTAEARPRTLAYLAAAIVAVDRQDRERAAELTQRALKVAGPRASPRLRFAAGRVLLEARPAEPDVAQRLLLSAEPALAGSDLSCCRILLSRAATVQGRFADALAHADQVLRAAEPPPALRAATLLARSRALAGLDRPEAAAADMDAAEVALRAAEPGRRTGQAWRELADLRAAAGDVAASAAAYRQALDSLGV
ncbi:MAG: helix-turn-helix domain-containing protein [Streptosporangiales bacterium]|nr:helix-turn-helix domain-containing protein [Streptosporangiales bacterium]